MSRVLRWLGVNLIITVMAAVVAYAVVWAAGLVGLRAADVEPLTVENYAFVLVVSALFMWPIYMALLAIVSRRRPDRFRLWALLLCPLLGLLLFVANLAVTAPPIQAADLFYVLYGATVRPLSEGS